MFTSIKKYNSIFDILLSKFTFGKHGFLRVEKEVSDLKKGNIPLFYALLMKSIFILIMK